MKPLLIPERTRNLLREEVNFDDLSHNWAVETFCIFGNSVTILISAFTGRQNEGLLILSRLSRPVSNQLINPDTKSDFSTISQDLRHGVCPMRFCLRGLAQLYAVEFLSQPSLCCILLSCQCFHIILASFLIKIHLSIQLSSSERHTSRYESRGRYPRG